MVVAFHHSGAVFFSKKHSALMGLVTLPAKDLKKYSLGIGSRVKTDGGCVMKRVKHWLTLAMGLVVAAMAGASETATMPVDPVLPPVAAWQGKSLELLVPAGHSWMTPFEKSGGMETPGYRETMDWLHRLAAAAPEITAVSLGHSYQGREIQMFIVSREGAASPEALAATGLPVVLVHAGIHSGEIDGKDAGMMLLRDLTVLDRRQDLLERVNLLFIPILNVDGHERTSRWGRINQRGPEKTGWRTNSRNQNLNRDFAKLDTPEIRALVAAINLWQPDLYVDVHVTDGMDHRYDITWGYNGPHAWSPAIAGWLDDRLTPAATAALKGMGHGPAPLFFPADSRNIAAGLVQWTGSPRFSNGYGDARHLPTVLVENHSLKPYQQRVLGTYVFLQSVLGTVGEHGAALRQATALDRGRPLASPPLSWAVPAQQGDATFQLAGIEQKLVPSAATGEDRVEWTGRPMDVEVPWLVMNEVRHRTTAPLAYWVPAAWQDVIQRLEWHGLSMETFTEQREVKVEMYRLAEVTLATEPFEGHVRVEASAAPEQRTESFAPGSVRVPVDQPLGMLAMLLLEPASADSFFQWGFFLEVLQRTEYVEDYLMDPLADRLLESDPVLRAAFQEAMNDPAFAADPARRRRWFYQRTPWFDSRWRLYPVAREIRQ
jgi:hypothetical protein